MQVVFNISTLCVLYQRDPRVCVSAVTVMHVSYEPKDGHTSESAYTGPVFEELDEELQVGGQ